MGCVCIEIIAYTICDNFILLYKSSRDLVCMRVFSLWWTSMLEVVIPLLCSCHIFLCISNDDILLSLDIKSIWYCQINNGKMKLKSVSYCRIGISCVRFFTLLWPRHTYSQYMNAKYRNNLITERIHCCIHFIYFCTKCILYEKN
jgi:hypothetical protein